jgi:STE24 endopeptidase
MTGSASDLDKAKAYQKKKQVLTLFHLFLTPVILGVAVTTPLSSMFKSLALGMTQNLYLALSLYFIFFTLYMLVFDLPFSFYSGFILEHRFELSNQTFGAWFKDFAKKTLLSFAFSLLLIEALFALIWNQPFHWWLFAWAGYVAVSYGLGKVFPVLIVPLFYRYGKIETDSLRNRILALAARYGLPVENVYTLDLSKTTKKANAAFMGIGRTKRVVLSDTLLSHFTEGEIETVVAHEMGHFKHRDIWKQLGFGAATSLAAFWLVFRLIEPASQSFGLEGTADIANLPLLFLIFYFFGLVLLPVQNGFCRRLERAADRFALDACPDKDVFVSCLEKLGKVNLADPHPHPLYEWFFYDHPAIAKRIRMAQAANR